LTIQRFVPFAWGVLGYNIVVILWGAVVRATGSGAGCGSHWPLCNGEVVPLTSQLETLIEFGHRMTSGLALLLVLLLVIWAFRAFVKGHPARLGAVLALGFIIIEALIGAGLVLLGLVEDNASVTRAIVISIHLINTFFLLASLALTAYWGKTGSLIALRGQGAASWILGIGLVTMLVLGVSGAITALGDTLFPVSSLQEGFGMDLSPTAHFLIELRVWHPFIAIGIALYWIFGSAGIAALRPEQNLRQAATLIAMLFVAQLGLGLINLLLLAPVWMQVVHLFMADLIWIALILFSARVLSSQTTPQASVESPTAPMENPS